MKDAARLDKEVAFELCCPPPPTCSTAREGRWTVTAQGDRAESSMGMAKKDDRECLTQLGQTGKASWERQALLGFGSMHRCLVRREESKGSGLRRVRPGASSGLAAASPSQPQHQSHATYMYFEPNLQVNFCKLGKPDRSCHLVSFPVFP